MMVFFVCYVIGIEIKHCWIKMLLLRLVLSLLSKLENNKLC